MVSERGYEKVSVEEIAARADLAKGTFYLHYENKEALLNAVFSRLLAEGAERTVYREGPWTEVRRSAVLAAFEHAQQMPDLYKVCLSEPRTRSSYLDIVAHYVEDNVRQRLAALGREPLMPIRLIAITWAGAHLAVLEAWIDGRIAGSPEDMASMLLDLLVAGSAWAQNINLAEIGYDSPPVPEARASNRQSARKPAATKRPHEPA